MFLFLPPLYLQPIYVGLFFTNLLQDWCHVKITIAYWKNNNITRLLILTHLICLVNKRQYVSAFNIKMSRFTTQNHLDYEKLVCQFYYRLLFFIDS